MNPLDPLSVDPDFVDEVEAARSAGFTPAKLDHDKLDRRIDPEAALRKTRLDGDGAAVYRGWMLTVEAYKALFDALLARNVVLLTSPEQYAACHHGPASYHALSRWMPRTVWLLENELDNIARRREVVAQFGTAGLVIKDWVKSQAAGYWNEACYISNASDADEVDRVLARFRELQAESLVGGIVFKEHVSLLPIHEPAHEYRAFVVDGRVVGCWPRSATAHELGSPPPELLDDVAANIPSPFASADFGLDSEGRWWLLEVGDGQVSGLPSPDAGPAIFEALSRIRLPARSR